MQAEMMNANFISIYDEVEDRFYYYVEKLIGVQVKFLTESKEEGSILSSSPDLPKGITVDPVSENRRYQASKVLSLSSNL